MKRMKRIRKAAESSRHLATIFTAKRYCFCKLLNPLISFIEEESHRGHRVHREKI
jgi:hypothetical protein